MSRTAEHLRCNESLGSESQHTKAKFALTWVPEAIVRRARAPCMVKGRHLRLRGFQTAPPGTDAVITTRPQQSHLCGGGVIRAGTRRFLVG